MINPLLSLIGALSVLIPEASSSFSGMVQKLGEYGVSAEKATQILEQYGAQAGVSSAFVEEMTGKVQALGKGFSESSSTIDTSSITVKESIKGIRKGVSAEAREDILVQAFLTCPNISEISKKTKIPRPTIYTVIHSDSFQRKYSEARNEAVTGAIAYLQGKLGECAAVLVNTAIDTEVPAQIRVNAANAALSQCSQWTKNVDMIERLETMEELMSRVEQEQKSQKRGK